MHSTTHTSAGASSLQTLLVANHVLIDLDATSKKRVFEELGFLFEQTEKLNRHLVTDSLFARERLGSTGLGHGVAIPHGRIKGLKTPHLSFVKLAKPIGFDALDDVPVSVMFVLLVPENASQKHLDLLSQIAELLGHDSTREALKQVTSINALLALVSGGRLT